MKKNVFFCFLHTIFGNLKDLPYICIDKKQNHNINNLIMRVR